MGWVACLFLFLCVCQFVDAAEAEAEERYAAIDDAKNESDRMAAQEEFEKVNQGEASLRSAFRMAYSRHICRL